MYSKNWQKFDLNKSNDTESQSVVSRVKITSLNVFTFSYLAYFLICDLMSKNFMNLKQDCGRSKLDMDKNIAREVDFSMNTQKYQCLK